MLSAAGVVVPWFVAGTEGEQTSVSEARIPGCDYSGAGSGCDLADDRRGGAGGLRCRRRFGVAGGLGLGCGEEVGPIGLPRLSEATDVVGERDPRELPASPLQRTQAAVLRQDRVGHGRHSVEEAEEVRLARWQL